MALATLNTVLRWLIALACFGAFGLDMFFIYVYRHNSNVVFGWQFFAETSLVCILFWVIVLSKGSRRVDKRRYQQEQYRASQDQQAKHPYDPEIAQHASYLPPSSGPYHVKAQRSGCDKVWSWARFLLVWCLSASILEITAKTIQRQLRFVFKIPFARDSAQADAINRRFGSLDPRNLYECNDVMDSDDLTTYLCQLNQQVINLATLAAFLAVIEAVITLILQNRRRRTVVASSHIPLEQQQQQPRGEPDTFYQAELANAHIVVIPSPPQPPAVPPVPPAPITLYSAYHPTPEAQPSSSRPLPPIPPHFASGADDDGTGTGGSSSYIHPAIAKPIYDPSFNVQVPVDKKAPLTEDGQDAAGPSHSYPADVKRSDGS